MLKRKAEEQFEEFLIRAKQKTYAGGKALRVDSSRKGSKDYHYEEENGRMIYHDTYFGGDRFIGEEAVYIDGEKPCWSMNYYGYVVGDGDSEEIFKVLRKALVNVGKDNSVLPLRGEGKFIFEKYRYIFKCKGTLSYFSGVEKIYKKRKLVYKLVCHGGSVK